MTSVISILVTSSPSTSNKLNNIFLPTKISLPVDFWLPWQQGVASLNPHLLTVTLDKVLGLSSFSYL